MAVVACFCGAVYKTQDDLAVCPNCHEPTAMMPSVSTHDVDQMRAEVDLMTRYPILADEDRQAH